MTLSIGDNIGAYRITEQLGQGGMATVFKAYHAALDRYVALKVLHEEVAADEVAVAAFLEGAISFQEIPATIKAVVGETQARIPESISEVLQVDADARRRASERIQQLGPRDAAAPTSWATWRK